MKRKMRRGPMTEEGGARIQVKLPTKKGTKKNNKENSLIEWSEVKPPI